MPGVSPSTLPTDPTRRGSRSGASGGSALTATVSRGKPAGNVAALYIGIGTERMPLGAWSHGRLDYPELFGLPPQDVWSSDRLARIDGVTS